MKEFYEDLIIEQNSVGWNIMSAYNELLDYYKNLTDFFIDLYIDSFGIDNTIINLIDYGLDLEEIVDLGFEEERVRTLMAEN